MSKPDGAQYWDDLKNARHRRPQKREPKVLHQERDGHALCGAQVPTSRLRKNPQEVRCIACHQTKATGVSDAK